MIFQKHPPLEKRKATALSLKTKYPGRLPIIVEKANQSDKSFPDIDKNKFLVPSELTVGQFIYVIRKRMRLEPEKAMFIYVKNILPPSASSISLIYDEYKDDDGFLYVIYSGENTFG